ncbi:histidine-rich protein PFHRP-II [Episyrphus balteatus]|uniref:histidine-rich protein PFHRP-II n=1 Tax=Episyrphus balteatus TaxID=286459 RepID=UPI0024856220|nr:histidine-rich protein PFHRP-II [Episyrphus balteatus]
MRPFIILAAFLVSTCSASIYGALSTQYHTQDKLGQYSYGYADPNSQKNEVRLHDGVTRGSYSYVDANGHVQSVSYVADPHNGFNAVGTNFPQGPAPGPVAHAVAAPLAYAHAPVALHNGVPIDTPEVQLAKAEHFAAHAAARSGHHLYKRSLYGGPWAYAPQHVPVIVNGVPVETAEVQHAKAAHFAAHAEARGHSPSNGAPIDTPEVQHAKAAHFAAHSAARAGIPVVPQSYHVPIIHNGVPVDTPEVQHARAAHYAALSEASARAGPGPSGPHYAPSYNHGPIHIPVIHNGVPVDTPEVQHARAAHLNALAAASHGSGPAGYGEDDGQYREHYSQW